MKRLTAKVFLEFVNKEFERFEASYIKATKVERTRYTQDQYQSGACKLVVSFEDTRFGKHHLVNHSFLCFYSLGEYQEYLKNGYEMYMRFMPRSHGLSFKDLEIEVRKITKPKQ